MKKLNFFKIISLFFTISLILLFFVSFSQKSSFFQFLDLSFFINWLIVLTIVFSSLFFYSSRYRIDKVDLIINNQIDLDNLKKDIFKEKYPLLSKFPLFWWFYKNWFIYNLVFLLIIIIWFSNIFINLWKLPFHQDEVFHFSPAVTYNQTWEFAKWDFLYDEIWDYKWSDRNKSLTIITSYSQKLFWLSEFSSRLPVAIIWFLWMFLIYFISIKITWNKIIWLIAMYIYSVNDVILYFSWFIRAYIILIVFSLILFYLLYKFLILKDKKSKLIYALFSIWIFSFSLFELHWTAIVLFPLVSIVFFIWILQIYNFKKYLIIYILFIFLLIIFILNAIWIIYLFKLPFGIQNMINLNIDFLNPQKIYIHHITNPYNIWVPLIFLLFSLFFINFKKNLFLNIFFIFSIIIPLIFSLYFFNRYEDFRYISLIAWIFIIYISIYIYYIWILIFADNKNKYLIIIIISLIFIPFQFPYILEIKPFTKESQAEWENIEWSRLHFRVAQPDNVKAFDYIFNNFENSPIVRLPDGWLNWDDNYYLSKYLEKYEWKKIIFYTLKEFSTKMLETYNYRKTDREKLNKNMDFFTLVSRYKKVLVIWNTRDLVDKKIMDFLNINCKNISWDIWIVQYRIFEYAHPIDNYFPNVFVCEKQ